MSLFAGTGPLGPRPAGWGTPPLPADTVFVEPHPRRVRAVRGGHVVLDTEDVLLVHRRHTPLAYAFPVTMLAGLPHEPLPEAPGYATVPWDAVDTWTEEGRTLVHYPPNPYHRVDCRPTTRRLRVEVAGAVLVDTRDTVILFETSLTPRLYVAPSLVDTGRLWPSSTTSYCNYKGVATYWTAMIGDTVVEDVAWTYPDPHPESSPIAGRFSFDGDVVDVLAELPGP